MSKSASISEDIQSTYNEATGERTEEFKVVDVMGNDDHDEKQAEEEEEPEGKASLSNAIFNLSNCAIGGSMLCLPENIKDMGVVGGILVILMTGLLASFTLYIIGRVMNFSRAKTYSALAAKSFGRRGEMVTVIVFLILLLAPMLMYHIVIGKNVENVAIVAAGRNYTEVMDKKIEHEKVHAYEHQSLYAAIVAVFIIFPLSLINDMSKISKFSIICLVAILYFVFLIFVEALLNVEANKISEIKAFNFDLKALSAFGNIIMSFCTQTSIVDIFRSIKTPTLKRQSTVNLVSNGIVSFIYVLVAMSGIILYGSEAPSNALLSGKKNEWQYLLGRVLFAVMMALSYPFLLIPARNSMDWILLQIAGSNPKGRFGKLYKSLGDQTKRIALSLFFIFVPFLVTVFLADLGFVANLFGGTAGACICFIFPCAFFLKLGSVNPKFTIKKWERIVTYIVMGLGILIFFACGTTTIYEKAIEKKD